MSVNTAAMNSSTSALEHCRPNQHQQRRHHNDTNAHRRLMPRPFVTIAASFAIVSVVVMLSVASSLSFADLGLTTLANAQFDIPKEILDFSLPSGLFDLPTTTKGGATTTTRAATVAPNKPATTFPNPTRESVAPSSNNNGVNANATVVMANGVGNAKVSIVGVRCLLLPTILVTFVTVLLSTMSFF